MCGIAGLIDRSGASAEQLEQTVTRMRETLRHRGPDDAASWVDADAGVALGHRRLSIIDLSPAGRQPMRSASGRWTIVYNGEVYAFAELRAELEAAGVRFRGDSDTEVMLEAIDAWGLPEALARFDGMFAFALWDARERVLHLARDRLGIKPLYYGMAGGAFVFGSELRALRAHPGFDAQIDRGALALMLRYNHVPSPYSIFSGIRKLPPGTLLTVPATAPTAEVTPQPYWRAADAVERARTHPFDGSAAEAAEALDALLRDAVARRMVADVPLGAFLSGGIDSSTVVALMQAQSDRPVRTFAIGFPEEGFDEAPYARAVAEHLRTDHTELYVTQQQALAVVPRLPEIYDEPFADSSQIPTFLVSQLARRHVTVSLSGDGGDELFWGYRRYFWARNVWRTARLALGPVRAAAGKLIEAAVPLKGKLGRDAHRLAGMLGASAVDRVALYHRLMSHWQHPDRVVIGASEPPTAYTGGARLPRRAGYEQLMGHLDTIAYLPDDLLVKTDRASMAVGLEARVPLIDHRVVEWAAALPARLKIRGGAGKWILRQVLYRYVPPPLVERPKMGFGVPLGAWLRGELRPWAEALLDEARLRREGFFEPAPIREAWEAHIAGARDAHYDLWNVLMFQAWLEQPLSR